MKFETRSIGAVRCHELWNFDAPRQPGLTQNHAVIEIDSAYTQALCGLKDFSRIWVVFLFHKASEKMMIRPPRLAQGSVGVFASRSPHRPNRIGISCVKLLGIEGSRLQIGAHDFLDGTPVLDIKPYLTQYDSFQIPEEGWLTKAAAAYTVEFMPEALQKLEFLSKRKLPGFKGFLEHQLSFLPEDAERKRIKKISENEFVISYRTWRAYFMIDSDKMICTVRNILSGWSVTELADETADPWKDKNLHIEFCALFA